MIMGKIFGIIYYVPGLDQALHILHPQTTTNKSFLLSKHCTDVLTHFSGPQSQVKIG